MEEFFHVYYLTRNNILDIHGQLLSSLKTQSREHQQSNPEVVSSNLILAKVFVCSGEYGTLIVFSINEKSLSIFYDIADSNKQPVMSPKTSLLYSFTFKECSSSDGSRYVGKYHSLTLET